MSSPLYYAVMEDRYEATKLLLACNADPFKNSTLKALMLSFGYYSAHAYYMKDLNSTMHMLIDRLHLLTYYPDSDDEQCYNDDYDIAVCI